MDRQTPLSGATALFVPSPLAGAQGVRAAHAWEISHISGDCDMTAIAFDIAHYGETTEDLRQKGVSFENKATDWSREGLCGLFSGRMTVGDMTATLCAILKPKMANGKAGTTLSSLRNVKGGDAIRKVAEGVIDVFEASNTGAVAEAFRPVAIAFATASPDAPKSLNALRKELAKLRAEASKAAVEAADNAKPEGEGDGEGEEAPEAKTSLAVVIERAALAIAEASADDLLLADDAIASLMETIKARYAETAEAEEALAA
jgi:hypothetical protein